MIFLNPPPQIWKLKKSRPHNGNDSYIFCWIYYNQASHESKNKGLREAWLYAFREYTNYVYFFTYFRLSLPRSLPMLSIIQNKNAYFWLDWRMLEYKNYSYESDMEWYFMFRTHIVRDGFESALQYFLLDIRLILWAS